MPVLAHDDQVDPLALGVLDNRLGRVPSHQDRSQHHSPAVSVVRGRFVDLAKVRFRSLTDLINLVDHADDLGNFHHPECGQLGPVIYRQIDGRGQRLLAGGRAVDRDQDLGEHRFAPWIADPCCKLAVASPIA